MTVQHYCVPGMRGGHYIQSMYKSVCMLPVFVEVHDRFGVAMVSVPLGAELAPSSSQSLLTIITSCTVDPCGNFFWELRWYGHLEFATFYG